MIVLLILEFTLQHIQDDPAHLLVFILLLTGFIIYYFLSEFLKKYFKNTIKAKVPSYYSFIAQRILGFFTFGLIPFAIVLVSHSKPAGNYGLNFNNLQTSLFWTAFLSLIIIVANYFLAGKKQNLKNYPQIRLNNWSIDKILINSLTWILYLFGYELMFRGLLLFSFYYAYGTVVAIAVNCVLYSLVHIPKGKKETIGAIPLGIILSFITLNTGSIFVAFAFHVIMALSNDYFAIKAHPSMTYNPKKN